MQNIHGVQVTESPVVSAPPIPVPNISAIGIVGTAPDIVTETPNLDANGGLTEIRVTNQGSGYDSVPTVGIPTPGGNGTQAVATAIVVAGRVTEIVIDTPGSGYTSAPTITITGGGTPTVNAEAEAITPGKFTKKVGGENVAGYNETYLVLNAGDAKQLGDRGTLAESLDAIFAQQRSARVIVTPIQEYETTAATAAYTRTWVAPGTDAPGTVASSDHSLYIGGDGNGVYRIGATTGTTPTKAAVQALAVGQEITLDAGGTDGVYEITGEPTANASYVDIPVKEKTAFTGTDPTGGSVASQNGTAKTLTAAIGQNDDRTGVYALLKGKSKHGFAPRIILASGLDQDASSGALGLAMETVAKALRGIAYIDGPSTTHAAAIAAANRYGSDRVYFLDPKVKCYRHGQVVNCAASAFAAGLTMKVDAQFGVWTIPSNHLLNNVLGTERDIDFEMGSASSQAQLLNDAGIATVVNINGGNRLWGDWTRATGARKTWQFLNVRRAADMLYDAIADNHLWAVDRNITGNYLDTVANGVNALLDDLEAQEAILGGTCYPDPELNSERNLALGIVSFIVEFTPLYPARTVRFDIQLNTSRLANLVDA